MKEISPLLSVEDFFKPDYWEGRYLGNDTEQYYSQLTPPSWQCLSVEHFLVSDNWEGKPLAQSSTQVKLRWQCLSVDSFFSSCSWEKQRIEQHDLDESTWFTQKVSDFLQFTPWEGKAEVGALPKWATPKTMSVFEVAPALTLTELF